MCRGAVLPFLNLLFVVAALTASDSPPPACVAGVCPAPAPLHLGPVAASEVGDLVEGLQAAIDTRAPSLTIVIDSPGGSVGILYGLLAMTKEARANGTVITCRVDGMAASAAAIFLEAGCDRRLMTRGSQLLFHEPATQAEGKEWDFRRTANDLADTNRRIATLIAWRLGMTADEYQAWIADRDRWLDSAEALQRHAVDAVLP